MTIAANGTVITVGGTIWSGVNARHVDHCIAGGHAVIINDFTDDAHLGIDALPYAVTDLTYKIVQRSPSVSLAP